VICKSRISELLSAPFNLRTPASVAEISELRRQFSVSMSSDYFQFLLIGNGGCGDVGSGDYAMFWGSDEIPSYNLEYETNTYAPGLILFGSNGGGEAFAFDSSQGTLTIGIVPFVGLSLVEYRPMAQSFVEFLELLSSGVDYENVIGADLLRH
jgi:SMI1 / KNR4 family (SUKH-1)